MGPALPPPIATVQAQGRVTFIGAIVAPLRTTSRTVAVCIIEHPRDWHTRCTPDHRATPPRRIDIRVDPHSQRVELVEIYP